MLKLIALVNSGAKLKYFFKVLSPAKSKFCGWFEELGLGLTGKEKFWGPFDEDKLGSWLVESSPKKKGPKEHQTTTINLTLHIHTPYLNIKLRSKQSLLLGRVCTLLCGRGQAGSAMR